MHRLVRTGLVVALAAQAGYGAVLALAAAWQGLDRGYGERLMATTDARIARLLGAHADVYRAIVGTTPPGAFVVVWRPEGVEPTPALEARVHAVNRLRHLLNPERFMMLSMPAPVAAAEAAPPAFGEVWLLRFPDEASPQGRPGWELAHDAATFQLWVLRR